MAKDVARAAAPTCRFLHIGTASLLAALYMPFIRNGGLFIPGRSTCSPGDELFLLVRLAGAKRPLPAVVRVVWLTPWRTKAQSTGGIGVQFLDEDGALKRSIEQLLARKRDATGHPDLPSPTL